MEWLSSRKLLKQTKLQTSEIISPEKYVFKAEYDIKWVVKMFFQWILAELCNKHKTVELSSSHTCQNISYNLDKGL